MAKMRYPVLLIELDPTHADYASDKRFGVEQTDLDLHTFTTLAAAQEFMHEHDLTAITPTDIAALRHAHESAGDEESDE